MRTKPLKWIVPALLVFFLAPAAWALVSVDEIIRLHTAGLNQEALLLVVVASETPDTLSTEDLTLLIDANVPDTVITELVAKADAVMEDWQPVNVDEELGGRKIYTEAEVNVYPQWYVGGGWGGYSYWDPWYYPAPYYDWYYPSYRPYWGWCGTWGWPYYGSGLYVGIGWGGWGISVGWGGGYWGGGYCGYWGGGGWCGGGYYPSYPGTGYTRYVDRPNYRHGVHRDVVRDGGGRSYRTSPTRDVGQLTSVDYQRSVVKDATRGNGRYEIRDDLNDSRPTRTGRDLTMAQLDNDKSTIKDATVGKGRYELKGDATEPKVNGTKTGRKVSTMTRAADGSNVTRYQKGTDRSLRADITKSSSRKTDARKVERTRTETKQQQLNRYKNMKRTDRTVNAKSGRSTGSTRKATTAGRSTRSGKSYQPSTRSTRSTNRATTGTSRSKSSTPKAKSGSKTRSTAKATAKSGGTRSKSSAPRVRTSSPRSSGGRGAVSRGGASGARSGGARSGGGSRGGSRGGRR